MESKGMASQSPAQGEIELINDSQSNPCVFQHGALGDLLHHFIIRA